MFQKLKIGKKIKKGEWIGKIGNSNENGKWLPHLHFQIILDLLGPVSYTHLRAHET